MITADELRSTLLYDPATGLFTWRIKARKGRAKPGDLAGSLTNSGHVRIKIRPITYLAHRLAWLYMTGEWPADEIDHVNRVRADNRWCNLREASRAENVRNRADCGRNTSGHRGVYWEPRTNRWYASIYIDGKNRRLGSSADKDEVIAMRVAFERAAWGEFSPSAEQPA